MLHIAKWSCLVIFMLWQIVKCNSQSQIISNKPEFEVSLKQAQKIIELGKNHYLIDFGKAYFGTLVINPRNNQTDILTIHIGEELTEKNSIDRDPSGTIRYQQIQLAELKANKSEIIKLFADKRNSNPPAIILPESFGVVMPFRYCELENLQIPIEDLEIFQKTFTYKFNDKASSFTSSDTVLNQVWDLCKHTIKATTFSGYYVDGDRERIPYEADAYVNQLSHYSVDTVYSIARRTNEYFLDHATWPTEWLLHTLMLFYQDYMYTGNVSPIKKHYDVLKLKTLEDLARADGLISSMSDQLTPELKKKLGYKNPRTQVKDIVDWPAARGNTGKKWLPEFGERDAYDMVEINTVVNSFYYHNMVLMAEIANALGKKSDAAVFYEKSKKVKETINTKLLDTTRGIYMDGEGSEHASLHANMFPLAFGLVPEESKKTVIEFIKSRGMACSVYGAQYLLEGLFKANESDYALQLITDTSHDRTWWHMIKSGSSMTWEAWDQKYKSNLDWNHAWGTAPLNIVARHMWGITPKTPGFANVQIKPQMGYLTSSEIKVPTIKGCIYGKYQLSGNNVAEFEIKLPINIQAEFILPTNCIQVIKGKYLNGSENVLQLEGGKNKIKLKFESKL